MYDNKTIIGIIPARSGSKGLPDKNILPFAGKPLMAWTILTALGAGVLDEVFVSTDSGKYAEIARQYGASVPFLRPRELAGDACPASGYILHALREYRRNLRRSFDYFALLQPTTPMRTADHIREGVKKAIDENLTAVVSFSPFDVDPKLIGSIPEDLNLSGFSSGDTPNDSLRQDARQLYVINGMVYVCRCDEYEKTKSFYGWNSKAMTIDKSFAIDIDDETDFLTAEHLAKRSGRFV